MATLLGTSCVPGVARALANRGQRGGPGTSAGARQAPRPRHDPCPELLLCEPRSSVAAGVLKSLLQHVTKRAPGSAKIHDSSYCKAVGQRRGCPAERAVRSWAAASSAVSGRDGVLALDPELCLNKMHIAMQSAHMVALMFLHEHSDFSCERCFKNNQVGFYFCQREKELKF